MISKIDNLDRRVAESRDDLGERIADLKRDLKESMASEISHLKSDILNACSQLTVSVTLNVYDVEEFRWHAYQCAVAHGLDEDEAREYTNPESKSLGECAWMIIDPGISPDGCELISSAWEEGT